MCSSKYQDKTKPEGLPETKDEDVKAEHLRVIDMLQNNSKDKVTVHNIQKTFKRPAASTSSENQENEDRPGAV
jgi:hypothetical protein